MPNESASNGKTNGQAGKDIASAMKTAALKAAAAEGASTADAEAAVAVAAKPKRSVRRASAAAGKAAAAKAKIEAELKGEGESVDDEAAPRKKRKLSPEEAAWEKEKDAQREANEKLRESGKLKAKNLALVRKYAAEAVEEDGDEHWEFLLKRMSDAQIWEAIQWCDFERGIINMASRAAKAAMAAKGAKPKAAKAVKAAKGKGKSDAVVVPEPAAVESKAARVTVPVKRSAVVKRREAAAGKLAAALGLGR